MYVDWVGRRVDGWMNWMGGLVDERWIIGKVEGS